MSSLMGPQSTAAQILKKNIDAYLSGTGSVSDILGDGSVPRRDVVPPLVSAAESKSRRLYRSLPMAILFESLLWITPVVAVLWLWKYPYQPVTPAATKAINTAFLKEFCGKNVQPMIMTLPVRTPHVEMTQTVPADVSLILSPKTPEATAAVVQTRLLHISRGTSSSEATVAACPTAVDTFAKVLGTSEVILSFPAK